MASDSFTVHLAEPFQANEGSMKHTDVSVSVRYDKSRHEVRVNFQAVEIEADNGSGFNSMKFVIFASPSGSVVLESGWKRDNAKKVAAILSELKCQVESRSGRGWDLISAFAVKHGIKL